MSEAQSLHIFGGKGGVGKTTLCAAFALNLAEKSPSERVLLLGAEGSESLSDLLKKKIVANPAKLLAGKGSGGLYAAELDATSGASFLQRYREGLSQLAPKGAVLSDADLLELWKHSAQGLEPLGGLLQILEWLEGKSFDRVVVDTGAVGQTLQWLDAAGALRRAIGLGRGEKPADKTLRAVKKEAPAPSAPRTDFDEVASSLERLGALLKDPALCAFHLVTLGEPVAEANTRLYFHQLRERGIPVQEILVNQVEDRSGCPTCQGRRGLQAPHVRKYQQLDRGITVQLIAKRESAPRGLDAVRKLAKEWATGKETKALEFSAAEGPPALVRAPSMPPIAAPPLPATRLIFFVGQGGVGKSSCAAAAAVTLTEKEGPVLLISTDPAHSLSDVLQSRLTDTESQVKGTKGLYARELDAPGWFNGLKKRIREKADPAFEAQKPAAPLDREALRNLLELAPGGMDELAALAILTDALVQERFKRIVVDPSPAGWGVRVAELPKLAESWLTAVLGILVKYRNKGLGDLADEISALVKHVKRFEEALASPSESRFVVVTRGEDLAAPKTERLVEWLKNKKLAVERVLVNRVLPKSSCPKCENRRRLELLVAKGMEKRIGLPITVAPALGRHPAGLRELKAFRTSWYALSATAKTKAA